MTALFLSPHNDDETLFGAFSCLAHKPFVVVVFRSFAQERQGVSFHERERETAAAMSVFGCSWEQWSFRDDDPDWNGVEVALGALEENYDRVFAPAAEVGGHIQHSGVGNLADAVFGEDRVTHYLTYTDGRGRSEGVPVPIEPWMVPLKLMALACYESQIDLVSTGHHFLQGLHEWYEK